MAAALHRLELGRRQFVWGVGVAGLGLLVGCGRLPGQAVPAVKIARIGYLSPGGGPDPGADPFREGLRDFGYVEGQNVAIEWRFAARSPERLSELALELVELPVDVIIAPVSAAALAVRSVTSTMPVIFVNAGDPVRLGLVADLARPGGNATGLSSLSAPLGQKRVELLKEIAPQAARIASLYDTADPASVATLSEMIDAARVLGVTLEPFGVRAADELDNAFKGAKPADLPVEQAREFELILNLKTAQALGLAIPQHVLLQATEVIQ